MRRPIIAGNWKMNTDPESAFELMDSMLEDLDAMEGVDVVICPPYVSLESFGDLFDGTSLYLGAQNMYWKDHGAYTGEISPLMLKGMCDYVIIGHSERRQYFHETDEEVRLKVEAALEHNIMPIICVGEQLLEHETGQTLNVVSHQVTAALAGLDSPRIEDCVIAYEPVWAIGTGRPATGEGANLVIGEIRRLVATLHGDAIAQAIRLQYGGSVNDKNIAEFVSQPEIDGALVGSASLNPDDFVRIVAITQQTRPI
jgi:triosephosphate isomerase (TIM)